MDTATFDYELPADLIAQQPTVRRTDARLMVVERRSGQIAHRRFDELGEVLRPGDRLVLNDTKVVPARLIGRRLATGGKWEGLFVREREDGWEMLSKTRGRLAAGERVALEGNWCQLEFTGRTNEGTWIVRPLLVAPVPESVGPALDAGREARTLAILESLGRVPLPPYIRKGRESAGDRERYQTVFARRPGAVAAPTAALHFSQELLADLESRGILREFVTLHVGPGTFLPVKVHDTSDHRMHAEWCELAGPAAGRLAEAKAAGNRIVAVGTTVVRVLESACRPSGKIDRYVGWSDLFIVPPYAFRAVDLVITNFHLPRSTLFMLVCAFAGRELIQAAYRAAVQSRYRFYSYGDAMLIL